MSGMPGPWSRATRTRPSLPSLLSMPSVSSPFFAYSRMLRASSEIAVAMRVRWLFEKPICWASARPRWRAVTMSTSESIGTRVSSFKEPTLTRGAGPPRLRIHASPRSSAGSAQIRSDLLLRPPIQERQALFQVERRGHSLERQAELDHREGDLALDPDDDGLRSAQPDQVGDVAQGPRGERVHHVHRRDIHDDPARSEPADLLDELVPQLQEVGIGQSRLHAGDEIGTLLENRDGHGAPPFSWFVPASRPARPCSPRAARPPRCPPAGRRRWSSWSDPRRCSPASARSRGTVP